MDGLPRDKLNMLKIWRLPSIDAAAQMLLAPSRLDGLDLLILPGFAKDSTLRGSSGVNLLEVCKKKMVTLKLE